MEGVTLLAAVGASHCVLLAIVSQLQSRTPRASDKILTAILAIEGVRLCSMAAIAAGAPEGLWLYPHSLRLAIGPLILFYTLYMVGKPLPYGSRMAAHFLPMAIVTLALLLNRTDLYEITRQDWLRPVALIEGSMFVVYGYASMKILAIYRSDLMQTHSAIEDMNLGWFRWVCMFVTAMGTSLILAVFYLSLNPMEFSVNGGILFSTLSTLVFCYIISLKGIQQSRFFERLLVEESVKAAVRAQANEAKANEPTEKYVSSSLTKEEAEHFFGLLVGVMEQEKLYLRQKLKLADLAAETGLHPQQVSQVINQCANKHFYDFVNGYRVEEVLRLLKEENSSSENILEVADQSGFNSPATFYKYFRKYTGMSPKRYVKEAAA